LKFPTKQTQKVLAETRVSFLKKKRIHTELNLYLSGSYIPAQHGLFLDLISPRRQATT